MAIRSLVLLVTLAAAPVAGQGVQGDLRRFAAAYLSDFPDGVVEVRVDASASTFAGTYQAVTIVRQDPASLGKDGDRGEQLSALVDLDPRTVTPGVLLPLSPPAPAANLAALRTFVEGTLSSFLTEVMGTRVRVRWSSGPLRPTAVVPLTGEISTGYGWVKLPLGVSADGRHLVVGSPWPLDRDPREVRRSLLESADVLWDPGHEQAVVKLVEFSDYQCPGCKRAWADYKATFEQLGERLRHGMVNFPLVRNHPWAFRAAVAGTCVAAAAPAELVHLKDEMYRLQDSLTVESVDEAVFGFLLQRGLDEPAFRACYMKDAAIDRVLRQMELGNRLGVLSTPSYFANGELLPFGKPEVVGARLKAIIAAGGKPEAAVTQPR